MLYVSFSIGSLLKVLNRCSWYGKAKAQAKERKTQIDSPRNSEAAPRVRGVVSGHYAVARRQLVRQQSGLIKDQLFLVVASLEGVPRRGHHFFVRANVYLGVRQSPRMDVNAFLTSLHYLPARARRSISGFCVYAPQAHL